MPSPCGRLATCLALRVRDHLWAYMVQALTGFSNWDALDKHWLEKIDTGYSTEGQSSDERGRRRVFESIHRYGYDPSGLRGLNGKELIKVVHKEPSMAEAKALFESPLWVCLSTVPGASIPMQTAVDRLVERWGTPMFLSLSQAMATVLHGRRLSKAHLTLLLVHATDLDSVVLMYCVYHEQNVADDEQMRTRYEQAMWFLVDCFLRRWCVAPREWRLPHLILTRLLHPQGGPWAEHELALGGFPVRWRQDRPRRRNDGPMTAELPYTASQLRTRLDAGSLATSVQLAQYAGVTLSVHGPTAPTHARWWLVGARADALLPPSARVGGPETLTWGPGQFRPRRKRDRASVAAGPAAMPAWPMDDQVSQQGRFLPR